MADPKQTTDPKPGQQGQQAQQQGQPATPAPNQPTSPPASPGQPPQGGDPREHLIAKGFPRDLADRADQRFGQQGQAGGKQGVQGINWAALWAEIQKDTTTMLPILVSIFRAAFGL